MKESFFNLELRATKQEILGKKENLFDPRDLYQACIYSHIVVFWQFRSNASRPKIPGIGQILNQF